MRIATFAPTCRIRRMWDITRIGPRAAFAIALAFFCFPLVASAGAIHDAVRSGDKQRVARILAADPDAVNRLEERGIVKLTPLALAVQRDDYAMVKYLLSKDAEVNKGGGSPHLTTPLVEACRRARPNIRILRELLAAKADPNAAFHSSHSTDAYLPLHLAASRGDAEAVALLLEHGADPTRPSGKGSRERTPLEWLVHTPGDTVGPRQVSQVAKLLIEAGADVNIRTEDGRTPLMSMAERGWTEPVKALLDLGADPLLMDKGGMTARALAANKEHWGVVTILKQAEEEAQSAPEDAPSGAD